MGFMEILIQLKFERDVKKLNKKIKKINEEDFNGFGDISFFAVIRPKKDLNTEYEFAGGKFGETLKKNKLYAWASGSRDCIRSSLRGIEVSPGLDQYLELDENGIMEQKPWKNDFLSYSPVKDGYIIAQEDKKDLMSYEEAVAAKYSKFIPYDEVYMCDEKNNLVPVFNGRDSTNAGGWNNIKNSAKNAASGNENTAEKE